MGLTNKTNLKTLANLIRYEIEDGKNTAERVGKLFVDIIENTDLSLSEETNSREIGEKNLLYNLTKKFDEEFNEVSDTFKKFAGEVSLEDLDNMTSARYAAGQLPSFYKVFFSDRVVGLLFVYSDAGSHELTQVLHSTMIPQGGVVNGSHVDGEPRVLSRTYNFGSHQWSPWLGKPSFVTLSEQQYEALTDKDSSTYYFIYEDED